MAKKTAKTAAKSVPAQRPTVADRNGGRGQKKLSSKGPTMSHADESQAHAADANPFDIRLVKQLVDLMAENELSEVALQWKSSRIRLRRGGNPVAAFAQAIPMPMHPTPSLAPAVHPTTASANGDAPAKAVADDFLYIESPTVGTFYSAPSPEAPAYVKVGSTVKPDTVVCLVEAMKVYNDIPAGLSGVIEAILVENAAPVEFGQRLFKVRPA
jgi:acetyl-CoA carboxylase biotin carboxyl carrier protein